MDAPADRPLSGRAKWGEVAGNLVLAGLGTALIAAALSTSLTDAPAMAALAAYTAYAVLATLALAVVLAATRRLPTLRESRLHGSPAVVARSWSGEWRYAVALDAGIVVLAAALIVLGLDATGWLLACLLVGVVGLYFLVRVVLTLAGRRRNEALWLTPEEVVHDAPWGRERIRREQVTRVRPATGSDQLVLEVKGPIVREICPRPWRRGRVGAGHDRIVVSCARVGHSAADLARWLAAELATSSPAR